MGVNRNIDIFKTSIVVVLFLIAFAIFYYLVLFLPNKAKQEENARNLENRLKAAEQIDKRNEEMRKQQIYSDCATAKYNTYPKENYEADVKRDPANTDYYKKLYDDFYKQCLRTQGINP